jgi:hypothetical protein
MDFNTSDYGSVIARLLETNDGGSRLVPLVCERTAPVSELLNAQPAKLFPVARHPRAALAGLYLYFSCWDQAHELADSIEDPDGYFWHAIVHRQEPDAWNSGYWFRKVGLHPIFPSLAREAATIEPKLNWSEWDPFTFINYCEQARGNSTDEQTARKIQRAEWQLLFDHCARPASASNGAAN